jgi:hypothetical protein
MGMLLWLTFARAAIRRGVDLANTVQPDLAILTGKHCGSESPRVDHPAAMGVC